MAGVKLPPLSVLLLHLGACSEAISWAGRRPITPAALKACPKAEWLSWIRGQLKVGHGALWRDWLSSAVHALSRDGYGYGDGSGYGYGDGSGDGSGSGSGYGYGDGSGDGYGYGSGSGYGYGDGYGSGYGSGSRD